ncbi:MAG: hypothetical protein OXC81_02825 [Betaproteobacteria bacterium]|nr:hypothetical protein [Betaproteobacteria bacterium]
MQKHPDFPDLNKAKCNMDHIYNLDDPRPYFSIHEQLAYRIPDAASAVFRRLIASIRKLHDQEVVHIVDLGCSYGVNAAQLKYDLSMQDLYRHWAQPPTADQSPDQIVADQRKFFTSMQPKPNLRITGIDQANNAVGFAQASRLLDRGLNINLEREPLPEPVADDLATTNLLISTGCVGYVTEKSFDRLMPALAKQPAAWIANFVLRMFPYQKIDNCLAKWGYVTEKLAGTTFIQRRFASADEKKNVLAKLAAQNINPAGEDETGNLVAELYLSRPAREAQLQPLAQILPDKLPGSIQTP